MISIRTAFGFCTLMLASGAVISAPTEEAPVQVKVSFEHPEKFFDASDRGLGGGADKNVLSTIEKQFQELGKQYLAKDQVLEVTVTDIDLAGRIEPGRSAATQDLRVVRSSTWPRIDFRYALKQGADERSQGKVSLKDMNFQQRAMIGSAAERLSYERRMIEDWYRQQAAAKPATAG